MYVCIHVCMCACMYVCSSGATARHCCLSPVADVQGTTRYLGGRPAGVLLGSRSNAVGLGSGAGACRNSKEVLAGCTIKLLISGSLTVTYSNMLFGVDW